MSSKPTTFYTTPNISVYILKKNIRTETDT